MLMSMAWINEAVPRSTYNKSFLWRKDQNSFDYHQNSTLLVLKISFENKSKNRIRPNSLVGSDAPLDARGMEIDPHIRHILVRRFGHENISTAILPLTLIQEE